MRSTCMRLLQDYWKVDYNIMYHNMPIYIRCMYYVYIYK